MACEGDYLTDINQAYFCVFLRSSATVVLPTYQSSEVDPDRETVGAVF
jgi:hypothetical protein